MKKIFPSTLPTLILVLFIGFSVQAQGPGSLFVDAGPDQTIDCATGGCVDLTADFLETFDTSGLNYEVNSIPYNPPFPFDGLANSIDISTDDVWSPVDNLPFDFCFFGSLEQEFQVGSNGVIRFDVDPGDTSNGWAFSEDLPNNSNPTLGEANIFTPVHDIFPSVNPGNEIGYEVLGTFPNRVLVVSYFEVAMFSCTTLEATHMAVLYEFSNVIEIYIRDKPSCPGWNSGNAAVGIQNDAGSTAYVPPGRNTSDSPWTTNDEAWSIAPIGPTTYVFEWLDGTGTVISNNPTVNVCPTGSEIFTARVTWTNTCNGDVVVLEDTVEVTSNANFTVDLGPDIDTCDSAPIVLDASADAPPGALYEWFIGGVSQGPSSPANPTFVVAAPNSGIYSVEVIDPADPTCIVGDSIVINFFFQPVIDSPPLDLFICDDGGTPGIFDLTVNTPIVIGPQDPTQIVVTYLDGMGNPIADPANYAIVGNAETITIRLEDLSGTCSVEATFEIVFDAAIAGAVLDEFICDTDGSGDEVIDLSATFDVIVLNGQASTQFNISYHATQADADAGINPLPTPHTVVAPSQQIFIRFESVANAGCFDTSQSFTINVVELPLGIVPPPLIICDEDNDGFAEFDLTLADGDITGGDPDLVVTYHGTFLDADNGVLALPNPYSNDDAYNDVVYVRVESISSGCHLVIELELEVRDSPMVTEPAGPLRLCDDAVADGLTFFDLTVVEPEVLTGLDPTHYDIYYYEDEFNAIAAGDVALTAPDFSLAIIDPTNFLNATNPQIIWILVVGNGMSTSPPNPNGASGCYDIVPLELIVDPLPEDLGPFEMFLCDDQESGSTVDEISIFDLTTQDAAVTGGNPYTVTWFETPADELADIPIADPTMFANTITPQTVVGRVTTEFDCSITVTLTLTVLPNPTPLLTPDPIEVCDDDDDGIVVDGFDLTLRDVEIINGNTDVNILYYETLEDAEAGLAGTELVSPYTNIVPNSQIVFARVTRDVPPAILACYTIVELELIVIALPDMPTADFIDPMIECDLDGDGLGNFDLTQNDVHVLGTQDPVDFVLPITYYQTQADADAGINWIDPADDFNSGGQTIWVRLESLVTGCWRISSFELEVGTFPVIGVPDDLYLCDDLESGSNADGFSTFDLTQNTELINLGDETMIVKYYASQADLTADIPITTPEAYQNVTPVQQEIFVGVTNDEDCGNSTSFFVNVEPIPAPATPEPLVACDDDNDGFYNDFDLISKDAEIANGEGDVNVQYYETLLDAQVGDPDDALVSPYSNIIPFSQVIYARVTRDIPPGVNICYAIVPLELVVEQLPDAPTADFINPMEVCDDDFDGFAEFNLTLNDIHVLGVQDPADFLPITYHESAADADAGVNPIAGANAYVNLSSPQTIWVRLENIETGCFRVSDFEIIVNPRPILGPGPFEIVVCDDDVDGGTLDDGIATFDLTINNDAITLGDISLSVFFYRSVEDQDNNIPIEDPTVYQNVDEFGVAVNPQDIYITVFTQADCESRTDMTLRVLPNPTPNEPTALEVCDGSGDPVLDTDYRDGISQFDLTTKDEEILNDEPDVNIFYYATLEEATEGVIGTELVSPYTNTTANNQIIYARVTRDIPPGELPCYTIVELELVVNPLPDDTVDIEDVVNCQLPFEGTATILLDSKDEEILNGQDPSIFDVQYYEDPDDALAGINPIASDVDYPYNTTAITIYVGLLNQETGCYISFREEDNLLSFDLIVKEGAFALTPVDPYAICDNLDENDGIGAFTLHSDPDNPTELDDQADALASEILGGQDPAQFILTYHESEENAIAGINPLADIYVNVINPQVIYARVSNEVDPLDPDRCVDVVEVILKVEQLPAIILEEEYRLCVDAAGNPIENEEGELSPPIIDTGLSEALYSFVWTIDGVIQPLEVGPSIVALQAGVYEVMVSEIKTGCFTTATTTVVLSGPPETYEVDVTSNAFDATHAIEATATGIGVYIFSLDDGPFQDSGVFNNVEPGNHTVTIKDANGCGSVVVEVGVIDYPRFVTPNQDGYHDTWNIIGIANGDPTAKIYIFDRFGKLLKQLSPQGPGWDGTYNGNPLPSSDYWFRVEYKEDGSAKEFTGHFTLKR